MEGTRDRPASEIVTAVPGLRDLARYGRQSGWRGPGPFERRAVCAVLAGAAVIAGSVVLDPATGAGAVDERQPELLELRVLRRGGRRDGRWREADQRQEQRKDEQAGAGGRNIGVPPMELGRFPAQSRRPAHGRSTARPYHHRRTDGSPTLQSSPLTGWEVSVPCARWLMIRMVAGSSPSASESWGIVASQSR